MKGVADAANLDELAQTYDLTLNKWRFEDQFRYEFSVEHYDEKHVIENFAEEYGLDYSLFKRLK